MRKWWDQLELLLNLHDVFSESLMFLKFTLIWCSSSFMLAMPLTNSSCVFRTASVRTRASKRIGHAEVAGGAGLAITLSIK